MQELCDSVNKNKYRVKYIEGLRSDCDLEVEEIEDPATKYFSERKEVQR